MISFSPLGDSAMVVNLDQKIDLEINSIVNALHEALIEKKEVSILFQIPAFCSLTIGYDNQLISYDKMVHKVNLVYDTLKPNAARVVSKVLRIPVCYHDEFGLDISEVESQSALDKVQIIKEHTSRIYRVYMLGFQPGFPYMGKSPDSIKTTRKNSPRSKVPEGSVALAGHQTGIYPSAGPGGWQIIGRTPLRIFNCTPKMPFLFSPGDTVVFEDIDRVAFNLIKQRIDSDTFNWESIWQT